MKERIVIIFIAVTLGLIITTFAFFLYERSKPATEQKSTSKTVQPTSQPNSILLQITEPAPETVSEKRSITVKGTTDPENVVIISTNQEDTVATPTSQGAFSATISIDAGINKLITRSISPNGESVVDERVISFSPEDF